MSSLNPKDIALFIVTQGNWWTKTYDNDALALGCPQGYKGLRVEEIGESREGVLKEIKQLLPGSICGFCGDYPDLFEVLFADPEEIRAVQVRVTDREQPHTVRAPSKLTKPCEVVPR